MNAVTDFTNFRIALPEITGSGQSNRQLDLEYDYQTQALWAYMRPAGAPCFNLGMLGEIRESDRALERAKGMIERNGEILPVKFHVAASRCSKVFNYGGDLAHFIMLIQTRNEEALRYYAVQCIDALYSRLRSYDSQAITISLIQGEALGGGFESALASHVIIAEEGSRMGCPEVLFNLFPGMGAYSLLSRRVGRKKAEEMIGSGRLYSARELQEMGIVDIVAEEGCGEEAVQSYITQMQRRANGMRAMFECRHATDEVTYAELVKIIDIWIDAALRLEEKDIKMMTRLVRSQLHHQLPAQTGEEAFKRKHLAGFDFVG